MTNNVTAFRRGLVAEFTCTGCGASVFRVGEPSGPPTCSTCRFLPGWQDDPKLRAIFDPEGRTKA